MNHTKRYPVDRGHLDFCSTQQQHRIISRAAAGDSHKAIAEELGLKKQNVQRVVKDVFHKAANAGYSPDYALQNQVPPGFNVKGFSRLTKDPNGDPIWIKADSDKKGPAAILEMLKDAVEDYKGAGGKVRAPRHTKEELLVVYPMGDPHIGMYAWSDEAGEDFDLDIACANLVEATSRLVEIAPAADTAIILNLGDFFHADDTSNRTSRSGHALDVDGRWMKVYQAGMQAMIQCIDEARRKHKQVIVKNLIGNHDDHTSQTLAVALDAYFHADPRVEVDLSPSKFWYYQHGKVLIGGGHGDTAKPTKLPEIMAADVPEMWGSSLFRYWYTGHIHSQNVIEFAGVIWESFKTLAGKDAWHAGQGYRSGRDMFCIAHHAEHGEFERHRVDISMLTGKAA